MQYAMAALADNTQRNNLVVGLGRTGLSVARHLLEQGEAVSVTDSRSQPPMLDRLRAELPSAGWLGVLPESLPADVDRVVVSPGVPSDLAVLDQAREQGCEVVGDVELFARLAPSPIAAVTGSNGKSTVATLMAHLAGGESEGVHLGGNIGRPVLELLDVPGSLCVLELSSFQLESTDTLNAAVGVVLNVSEDHLDRYTGMDEYTAAKARLVAQSRIAVLNRDDPRVRGMAERAREVIWFGAGRPAAGEYGLVDENGETWLMRGDERLCPASRLSLTGRHNALNLLAALAALEALGLPTDQLMERLRDFRGLPHRMETVGEWRGIQWINDSKATNLGATLAALDGVARPVVLIAGGQGKGQDFSALGRALEQGVHGLVVMGEAADSIAAQAPADLNVERVTDMDSAVAAARRLASAGDAVLLSPACASFDAFAGFEARGRAFRDAVLASEEGA
jgi:UDP-N-acetylmuramoylalanine--D-glutamate ligase